MASLVYDSVIWYCIYYMLVGVDVMVNFRIVEGSSMDYEAAKQDYINGMRTNELKEKYNFSNSAIKGLYKRFREDGVDVPYAGNSKKKKTPKWIYKHLVKGITYYGVKRVINGELYNFGHFKTYAEAEQCRNRLIENNWEGLIKW